MAITLDGPRLRKLTRNQLQSLAKREVVRASGRTNDIIRRLMRKYPGGVPVPEDTHSTSGSSTCAIPNDSGEAGSSPSPVVETTKDRADLTVQPAQGEPTTSAPSPCSSLSSSMETLLLLCPEDEPLAGSSTTDQDPEGAPVPQPEATEAGTLTDNRPTQVITFSGGLSPVPPLEPPCYFLQTLDEERNARGDAPPLTQTTIPAGWRANEEETYDDGSYGGPNRHALVDTLRQLIPLVNTQPEMKARLVETRRLLQRSEAVLEKMTPDTRKLAAMREYLEVFTLGRMKLKPEIWDGTDGVRKLRMAWSRSTRKEEAETKWKETNELNGQQNRNPVAFSAFSLGIESDEDEIESLLTTPANSQSGRASSSKRPREESVGDINAELNGDTYAAADSGDGHRKKRTRS